jgi:hypothetical protein
LNYAIDTKAYCFSGDSFENLAKNINHLLAKFHAEFLPLLLEVPGMSYSFPSTT